MTSRSEGICFIYITDMETEYSSSPTYELMLSDADRLTKEEKGNLKIKTRDPFPCAVLLDYDIKSEGHIHQSEQLAPGPSGQSPHHSVSLPPNSEDGHLLFDDFSNTDIGVLGPPRGKTAFAVCGGP
jgi:hypothetical protein